MVFQGAANSTLTSGGAAFYDLQLNKTAANLVLADAATVNHLLNFVADNNQLQTGNFDLIIAPAGSIVGFDDNEFVLTAGAGRLVRQSLGASNFVYPVGADAATYNPLTLAENGASDDIGVRCIAEPLANGLSGAPIATGLVNTAWVITELTAGSCSLSVVAQWPATDELPGFDRADCGIAQFNTGTDWDLPPTTMGMSAETGPFTRQRAGITPGVITVAGQSLMNRVLVRPKIMLQGSFNTATMWMNDQLRTNNLVPTTIPLTYTTGKFVPVGWQPVGGYAVTPAVLAVTGNDAIVDWVIVWLKNPATPTVNLQSRVALLQRDGDVVDLDGVSPVAIPANAANYILAVGHRNHLSVRIPNGVGISLNESASTTYDFTTGLGQAFGVNPMKQVQITPPVFALWGGNANANTSVRATGPVALNDYSTILTTLGTPTNVLSNIYSNADLNMDGTVRATGPATINDYSRLLNILGVPTTIINEQ